MSWHCHAETFQFKAALNTQLCQRQPEDVLSYLIYAPMPQQKWRIPFQHSSPSLSKAKQKSPRNWKHWWRRWNVKHADFLSLWKMSYSDSREGLTGPSRFYCSYWGLRCHGNSPASHFACREQVGGAVSSLLTKQAHNVCAPPRGTPALHSGLLEQQWHMRTQTPAPLLPAQKIKSVIHGMSGD